MAGLAADGQLAHHNDEAAQDRQDQIDDEEREAAGGTHLIGEAPDVAQADCRADRGHQEPEIGSKAFSFFHCFLSLTDFCSYIDAGVGKFYRARLLTGNGTGHRHAPQVFPHGIKSLQGYLKKVYRKLFPPAISSFYKN